MWGLKASLKNLIFMFIRLYRCSRTISTLNLTKWEKKRSKITRIQKEKHLFWTSIVPSFIVHRSMNSYSSSDNFHIVLFVYKALTISNSHDGLLIFIWYYNSVLLLNVNHKYVLMKKDICKIISWDHFYFIIIILNDQDHIVVIHSSRFSNKGTKCLCFCFVNNNRFFEILMRNWWAIQVK